MGRYPYIDQAGDQSQKGGYQESCQTEIVRYKRNAEVFFFKNHCKEKNQAVARLTEPFRLEMKKAHRLVALNRLASEAFLNSLESEFFNTV